MSKRVKIILYSITGFFMFLYILVGSIAYYCVFNTKIDWEAFEKKFSYIASFFSDPNVPVEEQKQNKEKPKEELDEMKRITDEAFKKWDERYKEAKEWSKKMYEENKVEEVEITSFDNLKLKGYIYKTDDFEVGFGNIELVDYVDEVEKYKKISKIAIKNREDFLEIIRN